MYELMIFLDTPRYPETVHIMYLSHRCISKRCTLHLWALQQHRIHLKITSADFDLKYIRIWLKYISSGPPPPPPGGGMG